MFCCSVPFFRLTSLCGVVASLLTLPNTDIVYILIQMHRAVGSFGGQFTGQACGRGGALECSGLAAVLAGVAPGRHSDRLPRPYAAGLRIG